MSITIDETLCTGCGACLEICPGSLIRFGGEGRAEILRPERCWGCASCVRACQSQAIALYLGADMGGRGGRMTARQDGPLLHWTVRMPDGSEKTITVDRRDANQY